MAASPQEARLGRCVLAGRRPPLRTVPNPHRPRPCSQPLPVRVRTNDPRQTPDVCLHCLWSPLGLLAFGVGEGIRRCARRRLSLKSHLDLLEPLLSLLVDRRIPRIDLDQGVGDYGDGSDAGIPLAVGWNHIPRSPVSARMRQHLGEGLLVVVPVLTLSYVGWWILPAVVGAIDTP